MRGMRSLSGLALAARAHARGGDRARPGPRRTAGLVLVAAALAGAFGAGRAGAGANLVANASFAAGSTLAGWASWQGSLSLAEDGIAGNRTARVALATPDAAAFSI